MPTSTGSPLNLQKPISSEVVDLTVINSNYDTLNSKALSTDATIASVQGSITTLNTTVGASGTVQNAVKATNVAGGLVKQIPIQSAANTTTFVAAPAAAGKLLTSSPAAPYVSWSDPSPYKVASGIISSGWSSGAVSVDLTYYGFTVAPTVFLTPLSSNLSLITSVTLSSAPSTTGFTVSARTYNGTAFANGSPTTHWVAIQVNP
jgi:hypothetical protein